MSRPTRALAALGLPRDVRRCITHAALITASAPLCVDGSSPRLCTDQLQKMSFLQLIKNLWRWVFRLRADRALPVIVSPHLFLFVFVSTYFSGEMKAATLRLLVPANGGAMVERRWVDDRGHPSSCRFVVWVGPSPFGPGGPGGRGGN